MGKASRDKGARFERSIVRDVKAWLADWKVARNPGDRQSGEVGEAGDLIVSSGPFRFPFSVECKHYAGVGPEALLRDQSAALVSFWLQACRQAETVEAVPLLVMRRDRGKTYALMPDYAAARLKQAAGGDPWRVEVRVRLQLDEPGHRDRIVAVLWEDLIKVRPIALFELLDYCARDEADIGRR